MPNLVSVHGCPHPFRSARVDDVVIAGATLAEIVERGLDSMKVPAALRGHGHAYIGDRYVPREEWEHTIPEAGEVVTYRIVPQGGRGGGKNPLAAILTIAVIAVASIVTFGVGSVLAGGSWAWGFGMAEGLTFGQMALAAGAGLAVTAAGMLAVNALVPVKAPSLPSYNTEQDSQTYSIAGARNAIAPFGVVPVVLGRHRIVPPQGAAPYTEVVGNDQYVRQLFVLGYSCLSILGDFKVGETKINAYEEVQYEHLPWATSGSSPAYYTNDVMEQSLSIQLKGVEGWQTRVTEQDCDEISIDITFPRGLTRFDSKGNKQDQTVIVEAEYREVGTSWWYPVGGFSYISAQSFSLENAGTTYRKKKNAVLRPSPQWWTVCVAPYGAVECRKGTLGVDYAPGVPAGYKGIAQVRVYGYDITNIVSILPAGSTGLTVTGTNGSPGFWSGNQRPSIRLAEGYIQLDTLKFTARQTTCLRRTFTTKTPKRGFYEVRVRRASDDTNDSQIFDESWWATLRAIRNVSPINFPKALSVVSLRIRATGQLNGALDDFNVVVQSECLDWNPASQQWVYRPTSNPASLFLYVLKHPANTRPVPDSQIDLEALQKWHEFCVDNGYEYNRVHDFQSSVFEVLRDIAAAGRAGVARPDGKWSVVIDEPRTAVVQHFTPRNSWGFKSTKALPKHPHGWRVRFVNEDKEYQNDERIVYDDGYNANNATEFEGLELPGVTDAAQVWKLARYHLAVAKLRPEEYEFYADMEHIVCTRGDLIRMTHDVPLWGVAAGRVKSVSGQTVTVDEPCQMLAGKRYTVRFRTETGTSILREVQNVAGFNTTLTLLGTGSVPAAGDLFMFGELNSESVELIVKSLEPGENFTARVVAVDYSPAVYTADSGNIPAFDSQITRPYSAAPSRKPAAPVVSGIRSDEGMLIRGADGGISSRIGVDFTMASGYDATDFGVQVQYRELGTETWTTTPSTMASAGILFVSPVDDGVTYELRLRSITSRGVPGYWSETVTHKVIGKTSPPPDVPRLGVENKALVWPYENAPLDLKGFRIRCAYGAVSDWDFCSPVLDGFTTDCRFDISRYIDNRKRTWMVKAEDKGGRLSAAPAIFVTAAYELQADDPAPRNLIYTYDLAELGWPGYKSGCDVVGSAPGVLAARETSLFWDEAAGKFWQPADALFWSSRYSRMAYSFTWRPDSTLAGLDLREGIVTTAEIESIEYSTGSEALFWPEDGTAPFWTDDGQAFWGPFKWYPLPTILQRVQDRYYSFRVSLRDSDNIAQIQQCQLVIDVPDKREEVTTSVSAAGTRLPIAKDYRAVKYVYLSLVNDGGNAVTCRYMDKSTAGPMVKCYDLAGNPCAGTVDATVVGY